MVAMPVTRYTDQCFLRRVGGWCRILIVSILVVRWVGLCHSRLLLGVAGLARGRIGLASWPQWFSILISGIVFPVPSICGFLGRPLWDDPVPTAPVRTPDRLRTQP